MVKAAKIKAKDQIVIEAVMAEVAQCRADIARLQRTVEKLHKLSERSIEGFCERQGFSKAHFYNLRKDGRGPRIKGAGHRQIITPEDEQTWQRDLPDAEDAEPATNGGQVTAS
jgi:hypothetical protein